VGARPAAEEAHAARTRMSAAVVNDAVTGIAAP